MTEALALHARFTDLYHYTHFCTPTKQKKKCERAASTHGMSTSARAARYDAGWATLAAALAARAAPRAATAGARVACMSATTIVKSVSAPAWCADPSDTGTACSRVATPRAACALAATGSK